MNKISVSYKNEFKGNVQTEKGVLKIGSSEGEFLPYPLLMSALSSCLYSTFLDIIKKMRLEISLCNMDLEWEKRVEVPRTLKLIVIKVKIIGADLTKKEKLLNAFRLATEYCSIYNTLSKVSEMKYELDFE